MLGYLSADNIYSDWRAVFRELKLGNIQNCARCVKDLKDNKDNSLHLGRKYARIIVLGHYLFLVAHSFPRATLSENCSQRSILTTLFGQK